MVSTILNPSPKGKYRQTCCSYFGTISMHYHTTSHTVTWKHTWMTQYPLVIFLHGAGERGDDNKIQLVHGMKDFLDPERRKNMSCYVLAPQCPTGKKWVEVDWSAPSSKMPEQASDSLGLTIKLVQSMIEDAAVDPNRIYITGLSMGGYGTCLRQQLRSAVVVTRPQPSGLPMSPCGLSTAIKTKPLKSNAQGR